MATETVTGPAIVGSSAPTKVYKNFIDGEWVESSTGENFENRNPADTREVVGIFRKSGKDDVDAAVDAAYYMAGEGSRLFAPTTPSELLNEFALAVRQPLGVCGMITPWNFPM